MRTILHSLYSLGGSTRHVHFAKCQQREDELLARSGVQTISSLKFGLKALTALALVISVDAISLRAEVIYWPLTALDLAKQRVPSINCVNNLRQIGLAARIWSSENSGRCPSGILVFTNELGSPAVLFCPANIGHQVSTNWDTFDWGQIDYEWIPQANWDNPTNICCKCRIHDNVAFVDGSVRQAGGFRSGWPSIVAPPLGQYATPGSAVRFEVGIAPNALMPVSYQWRREHLYYVTNVTFVTDPDGPNGGYWTTNRRGNFTVTILSGETNSTYVIPDAQTNHSDYYSVVVRNSMGATASSDRLFVDPSVSSMATNNYWSAINCVNNLKQIALFGRMLANDHDEHMPRSLAAMTNSFGLPIFGWPVVLFCRFDTARTVPADWAGVDFANTSYEILPVDLPVDEDPSATFCRCKVHGFYARADGAVVFQPRFTGIRLLMNKTTESSFTVFAGQTNLLEASTNLVTWATLSSYPSTNGNFFIYDTNSLPGRFYRIRTQ